MISLFEKELIAVERELRDLKTQCRHGLGNTRFYAKEMTVSCTADYRYTFTATTMAGEPSPAFIGIFYSEPSPSVPFFTGNSADENSREFRFIPLSNTTIRVKAISTSGLTLTEEHEPYV